MENKSKELEIAIQAAKEAGKVLEKYFEAEILREYKDDNSVVTLADKEAEDVIKKIILENFPDHSILGEETGLTQNGADYKWYIDPLDGTSNFANGIPLFAVSLALEHKGEIIVGVITNPATETIFYTEKGKGAYCNDVQIYVSKDNQDKATVSFSAGRGDDKRRLREELYYTLPKPKGFIGAVRNLGCTALELAYVARGGLEANVQIGLSTYDFAAGIILIKEAGGMVTDYKGDEYKFPENYFIASNGVFHDFLIEEIQNKRKILGIE
jgi:myo-inositol-1(or 4)-monophosphatase